MQGVERHFLLLFQLKQVPVEEVAAADEAELPVFARETDAEAASMALV